MGKPIEPPASDGVEAIQLREALEERYLAYASRPSCTGRCRTPRTG
jgi:hypothetical protein